MGFPFVSESPNGCLETILPTKAPNCWEGRVVNEMQGSGRSRGWECARLREREERVGRVAMVAGEKVHVARRGPKNQYALPPSLPE